jgi:hypothetical protein
MKYPSSHQYFAEPILKITALKEERLVAMSGNRMLRNKFVPKKDKCVSNLGYCITKEF